MHFRYHFHWFLSTSQGRILSDEQYGSTGCRVFKKGGTKLERFVSKNQHTSRKMLNFENWFSGDLSNIGHHFSNKMI